MTPKVTTYPTRTVNGRGAAVSVRGLHGATWDGHVLDDVEGSDYVPVQMMRTQSFRLEDVVRAAEGRGFTDISFCIDEEGDLRGAVAWVVRWHHEGCVDCHVLAVMDG